MPRRGLTNIPHTAATDHRVPRRAESSAETAESAAVSGGDVLTDLFATAFGRADRADSQRDLGVALLKLVREGGGRDPAKARQSVERALKLLAQHASDDLPALAARVDGLRLLGRFDEAVRLNDSIVRDHPDDEPARVMAGSLAGMQQRWDDAKRHWGEAVRLSPFRAEYHLALAETSARSGDWPTAREATGSALRLNPALAAARSLLVQSCLATGDEAGARAALEVIIALAPAGRTIWEDWYAAQARALMSGAESR